MGLKLSCIHRGSLDSRQASLKEPVRVVAADGSLKEFPASPLAAVSGLLGLGGGGDVAFFVCNSDALYFNEHPPALAAGDLLRPGQIYFVLPAAMLGRPLSSAEMAELAVRASAALVSAKAPRRRGGKKKMRVMPLRDEEQRGNGGEDEDVFVNQKLNEQTLGESGVPLSPARSDMKKVAAAARARLRRALSIIREDAE